MNKDAADERISVSAKTAPNALDEHTLALAVDKDETSEDFTGWRINDTYAAWSCWVALADAIMEREAERIRTLAKLERYG